MHHVTRFSPDARRLQRDLDGVFADFFGPARARTPQPGWTPRVDVLESNDAYTLTLDLPGVPKDAVALDFHDGLLTVSGERTPAERPDGTTQVRAERRHGSFYRAFTLPKTIHADGIEASVADGVLTIRVPKAEETKPRRISVA